MRSLIPTALCCLLCGPARADTQLPGRDTWAFRTFSTADGLAHNIVRDVLEAADGTVWFATMDGVTRYRPKTCSYTTFAPGWTRNQREAMSLARGRDGALWVATQGGGVAAYRGGKWTWYTVDSGLPSDEITSLMVDRDGRLWATPTIGGIAMFDGKSWRTFTARDGLSSGEIGRCAGLRDGTVLCGTYEQPVLQRFDGERWSQLRVDAPARRHFYVHAITETRGGVLWLATKGAGAVRGVPDGHGGYRWTVFDRSAGLVSNRVGAILESRDGALWFATAAGASRFDGERWASFSVRDGLGANQVFAITESSRDGALWFATLGGGASRYATTGWQRITEADGLPSDNVTGGLLQARDGSLWLGTDRGLARLAAKTRRFEPVPDRPGNPGEMASHHINHMLQLPGGAIWVATRDGLQRLEGGAWRHVPANGDRGPGNPVVNRLALDHEGRLWAATAAGVSVLRGDTWTTYTRKDGLPSARIYDVAVDRQGRLWAATENGVARHEGGGRWTAFLSQGPASRTNRIYSLALDGQGRLWASGLEGVDIFAGDSWRRMPPNRWLPAGIYSRFVMSSADGSLWFGVRGLGVKRLVDGRWTAYPATDEALPGDTLRDVVALPDKSFLFATLGGGLRRYRPDRLPPQTFIGAAGERGTARGAPSSALTGEELVIPFGGQDVLKQTRTADLLFSHRVDHGPWSPFSPATRAWLPDLGPGQHLFEVRAMDQDLNVDPTPATHAFRVLRPWYAEPSFLGIIGFSLLLVIYALWRIGRAMRRERAAVVQEQATLQQRKRFVRLASHELRKPLTRLAHRAELLTLTLDRRDKAEEHAEALVRDSAHVSRLVETLLEQARVEEGLQLELRPGDLNQAARDVLAELGESETRPALRAGAEPLPVRYDPFYLPLAIRNLVENAIKYGGEGVEVKTDRTGDSATLVVRDRGPGIPDEDRERVFEPFFRGRTRPEHGGFGLGLGFAREIARAHGGELELLPPEGPGAAFCLSLPLGREPTSGEQNGTATDHR